MKLFICFYNSKPVEKTAPNAPTLNCVASSSAALVDRKTFYSTLMPAVNGTWRDKPSIAVQFQSIRTDDPLHLNEYAAHTPEQSICYDEFLKRSKQRVPVYGQLNVSINIYGQIKQ